jgi:hypothetical protein
MNILSLISEIEKVDPEVYGRLDSRRRVFQSISGWGGKIAAAAVPFALGSVFNKAYAGSTATQATVLEVLMYAYALENLEANFYNAGLGTVAAPNTILTAMLSANNLKALRTIQTDENNHVTFLSDTIKALSGTAPTKPATTDFDYTGGKGVPGGPFATVFTSAGTLLSVAQALEDTGVRAYKGGAPDLMSNKDVLTAALNIHSVEARHASRLRTMRRGGLMPANDRASFVAAGSDPTTSPKSWVSNQDGGGPAPTYTAGVYGAGMPATGAATAIFFPGEDNVTQAGVSITSLLTAAGITGLTATQAGVAATESFDEPLDMRTVKNIALLFVKPGTATETYLKS